MGLRLIILLHKLITWTSGEAYHPGHLNTPPTQETSPTQRERKTGIREKLREIDTKTETKTNNLKGTYDADSIMYKA